ncbi:porin [Solimicrobium silvestre]|uniref:Gram-negative porin n=1 Tax=Solimicrobium silvestre TaxID=2099400 RepID=A0A2S9GYU1_9BURK|nr:porin [Solimicrobium silvestre]PRC92881.1 Gram-negative porin [Solimicrobium silvestre]
MKSSFYKPSLTVFTSVLMGFNYNASAQSNITVFGAIDTALRYSTNQNGDGGNLAEVGSGAANVNRFGVSGEEDLGAGLKANFMLDAGFNSATGESGDGGKLFSRQAWVGLSGTYGAVTAGRQFSPVYNAQWAIEPFGWANLTESGFIYDNYAGDIHWDNSLMYSGTYGDFTGVLMVGMGEKAGDSKAWRNVGGSLAYASGLFTAIAAYQEVRNTDAVIANKVWNVGGSYNIKPVQLFFGYLNYRSDLALQKNHVFDLGFIYSMTPKIDLIGAYYHDRQRAEDGRKNTVAGMLKYSFTPRTAIYIQTDYSKIDAGYVNNISDQYAFPSTRDADNNLTSFVSSRASVSIGLRHIF